jgi:hypothetical protein
MSVIQKREAATMTKTTVGGVIVMIILTYLMVKFDSVR